jgi:hypothetical protein
MEAHGASVVLLSLRRLSLALRQPFLAKVGTTFAP